MGDGSAKAIAFKRLIDAMTLQVIAAVSENNPDNLFKPAAGRFFEMFAAGKDVTITDFQVEVASVERDPVYIEQATLREYSEDVSADPRAAVALA